MDFSSALQSTVSMSWAANHINHSSATLRVGNVSYSGIRKSVIACSYSRRSLKFPLSQILGILIIVPIVELVVLGSYCSAPRSARFLRVSSGHQVSIFASRVRFQSLRPAMTGSSSVAWVAPYCLSFATASFMPWPQLHPELKGQSLWSVHAGLESWECFIVYNE